MSRAVSGNPSGTTDDSVTPIDVASKTPGTQITVGNGPVGVAVTRCGTRRGLRVAR